MPAQYPTARFHFSVEWGSARIDFSEVTGLNQENQTIEYRDGSTPVRIPSKKPNLRQFNNITLRHGIVKSDSAFFKWLSTAERRDVIVSQLNEKHEAVKKWKLHKAFPVKVEAPQLKATANEFAIESIEIAHEGLELQKN